MKPAAAVILFFCAFLFQHTAAGLICAGGAGPDLLLVVTVFSVFSFPHINGVIAGAAGIAALQELCFSIYGGPGTAAVLLSGLSAAAAKRLFSWERPLFLFPFTAAVTLVYHLTFWGGERILGSPYSFTYLLKLQPLYIGYNLAAMGILYLLFIKNKESRSQI